MINFDLNYRFAISNNKLHLSKAIVVTRKFFRADGVVTSHVDDMSASIGENGTGKTSIAAFLYEVLETGVERS